MRLLSLIASALVALAAFGQLVSAETQQIFVKTLAGDRMTVKFDPLEKVGSLRDRLKDFLGDNPEGQRLSFAGKQLDDQKQLIDYKIKSDSTLQMVKLTSMWQIFVISLAGNRYTVHVEPTATVADLRNKIQSYVGDWQKFSFGETVLEDHRRLGYYSIQNGSTLYMLKSDISLKPNLKRKADRVRVLCDRMRAVALCYRVDKNVID